jgi:1-acyl-sn-glycerol-3-phosphate acyltransferase
LAVNHPNSFFDAIVVGVFFKQPVYFLARGDAFKNKWARLILTSLKCIPVYRIREGKEFLHLNESSFEKCREIFKKGGIVLIFSEGLCLNEWNIRALKKGTARLALSSWEMPEIGPDLKILPVGVNYSSFRKGPKKIWIRFGDYINKNDIGSQLPDGNAHKEINDQIKKQFETLCFDGVKNTKLTESLFASLAANADQVQKDAFPVLHNNGRGIAAVAEKYFQQEIPYQISLNRTNRNQSLIKAFLLFPIVLPGLAVYYPFYRLLKLVVNKKAGHSVHFDSIMFGLVTLGFLVLQPFIIIFVFFITNNLNLAIGAPVLLLLSAFILTRFIIYWQRCCNFNRMDKEQKLILLQLLHKN